MFDEYDAQDMLREKRLAGGFLNNADDDLDEDGNLIIDEEEHNHNWLRKLFHKKKK